LQGRKFRRAKKMLAINPAITPPTIPPAAAPRLENNLSGLRTFALLDDLK
jgi:hypothetical protein